MIVLSVQKCHHSILKKAGRCTFEITLLNQKENAFNLWIYIHLEF